MPRPVSLWAASTTDTIDRSRSTFLQRNPRASDRRNPVNAMNRNMEPHRVVSAEVSIRATTDASGASTSYRGTEGRSTAEQTFRANSPLRTASFKALERRA
jgi:hypothetical protein